MVGIGDGFNLSPQTSISWFRNCPTDWRVPLPISALPSDGPPAKDLSCRCTIITQLSTVQLKMYMNSWCTVGRNIFARLSHTRRNENRRIPSHTKNTKEKGFDQHYCIIPPSAIQLHNSFQNKKSMIHKHWSTQTSVQLSREYSA